jgi:LCP family protein required for cell wall assembly
MNKENKKSRWKLIAGIILIIQLVISAVAIGVIVWLNLLPVTYLVLIGVMLFWLLTVVYYFFYSGTKKKTPKRKRRIYIKRSIGCVISVCVMVVSILSSAMLTKAGNTLQNISSTVVTDTVSAYVLTDDPAQTLMDATDYEFAITEKYDYEHTCDALDKIKETTGADVTTRIYDNVFDMVEALYAGEVDAMILNAAYVDVIEAEEEYETFSDKTRTLFDHEIETVVADKQTNTQKDITKDPFVIYISGSDTRNFKLATSRSDVNILAVVNPTTKQVLLINTPRDYYVETSVGNGQRDKLTHCGIYGIDCSMDTLGTLYDEQVDYYAQINFSGFQTLVDAIGGITIESEKSFRCSEGGYYISQGTNQLNGTIALSYVRERKAFSDGDNSRGRHQMQAIDAIIAKVSSGTTILSNYSGILDSMSGMFTTNLSSDEMSALVRMQLSDMASWNVKSFAVSGTGSSQTTYSMPTKRSYVMIPDETQISYAKLLVDKVIDGVTLTDEDMEIPEYSGQ